LEEEVEGVTRLFRENLFQGVKATSGSVRMTYLTFLFLNPASRRGTGREGHPLLSSRRRQHSRPEFEGVKVTW